MGLFTWGSLPKDQESSQTISEYVAEAILAHEADPTAHLGAGESLQQHKNNEVIDHPASSILPDKFSQIQNLFYNTWQSITEWITSGTITNAFLLLQIYKRGNIAGDTYLYNETIEFLTNQTDDTILDNIFQTEFTYYHNYNVADYSFGMGVGSNYQPLLICAAFKIENGVLYTIFGDDSTYTYVNLGSVNDSKRHSVRVETTQLNQELNFYFDNVLVATYDISTIPSFYMNTFGIYGKKVGGTLSSQTSFIKFRYLAIGNSSF